MKNFCALFNRQIRYTNFQTITRSRAAVAHLLPIKKSSKPSALYCAKISAEEKRCGFSA